MRLIDLMMQGLMAGIETEKIDAAARIAKTLPVIFDFTSVLEAVSGVDSRIVTAQTPDAVAPYRFTGIEITAGDTPIAGIVNSQKDRVSTALFMPGPEKKRARGPLAYIHWTTSPTGSPEDVEFHQTPNPQIAESTFQQICEIFYPIAVVGLSIANVEGVSLDVVDYSDVPEDKREKWRKKRGAWIARRCVPSLEDYRTQTAKRGGIGMPLAQSIRLDLARAPDRSHKALATEGRHWLTGSQKSGIITA